MASSGMLRRVALVITDVSEELSASFIWVTRSRVDPRAIVGMKGLGQLKVSATYLNVTLPSAPSGRSTVQNKQTLGGP
jgi:hypothetical protein